MITLILYSLWIAYTVGSLSVIVGLITLAFLSHRDQKKQDQRIREMLTKRPTDECD